MSAQNHTAQLARKGAAPLEVHYKINSEAGLESVTSLIVGANSAVLIDAPFLVPDAKEVVTWIKEKTSVPLVAVFTSHGHPDHYFSASVVLEAWPEAKFLAAPYVTKLIDEEFDDKVPYWRKVYGEAVPEHPRKPDPYPFSFFVLPSNPSSPIFLMGPVQGDQVDHSMFYLPREKVLITGDCLYGRGVHTWAAEISTPALLESWRNILALMDGLDLALLIPGHLSSTAGLGPEKDKDIEYNREYLELFAQKVTYAAKKPGMEELYSTFESAFPSCTANKGFFLGKLADCFGAGGPGWKENEHAGIDERTSEELDGWILGGGKKNSEEVRVALG
ncbi:hypothetical protein JCM8097_008305 [Rhodosporidiobolus ruineniae]